MVSAHGYVFMKPFEWLNRVNMAEESSRDFAVG